MTVTYAPVAPLVIYRDEIEMAFNRRQKLLFNTVLTNFQSKGAKVVFEVADADPTLAVTRGANGKIPVGSFTQNQYDAVMETFFAYRELNKETTLYSQGNLEKVMTENVAGVINRTIDSHIISTLDTATQEYASGVPLTNISINTFVNIKAKLMQSRVPNDGEIYCVVNPSIEASLLTLPNVTNIFFSDKKNLQNPDSLDWSDQIKMYEFAGLKFIVMPDLPGMGTALETNYVYHKKAVGLAHLLDQAIDSGYDGRDKKYWVNADFSMASKIIQNTGIYKFYSDATALLDS